MINPPANCAEPPSKRNNPIKLNAFIRVRIMDTFDTIVIQYNLCCITAHEIIQQHSCVVPLKWTFLNYIITRRKWILIISYYLYNCTILSCAKASILRFVRIYIFVFLCTCTVTYRLSKIIVLLTLN